MSIRITTPLSIEIIREEHEHLSKVIEGMLYFVRSIKDGEPAPALKIFRAMLYYITEYPERVHHPKEDQYLFAQIKERTHQLDAELDSLSEQHGKGELMAHRLQNVLLRYEFGGIDALSQLRTQVEQYAHFYYAHMRLEEERILPVARQILNEADWKVIDTAFLDNRKMHNDAGRRYHYDQLFSQIMQVKPTLLST